MYRKRERGEPFPWTEDPVLRRVFLCNVFREQDRTTKWFRENIRGPNSDIPIDVFAYTVLFRWFNRIETGQYLFQDTDLAKSWLSDLKAGVEPQLAGERLAHFIEDMEPPYFTGAYMIKLDNGMDKHLSVAIAASRVVLGFLKLTTVEKTFTPFTTLQNWTKWLMEFRGLGGFMSYEVVSDLRWTCLARDARDIMSWANVGPGCARGLGRLYFGTPSHGESFRKDPQAGLDVMRWLLDLSELEEYWPQDERPWEMREVEHWLCEYDKIERARKEEGRIKRWYKERVHQEEEVRL